MAHNSSHCAVSGTATRWTLQRPRRSPANASPAVVSDFTFSHPDSVDDRGAGGSPLDWDLGAIRELNVAFMRRDRIAAPLFDDADLKIV